MIESALYLIPVPLDNDAPIGRSLPVYTLEPIKEIRHFIVENVRSARRFLKKCDRSINIDTLEFTVLDEHTSLDEVPQMLRPLEEGQPMGVISEAGCPAIADPGADVVAVAHRKGLKVVPLVGPSSILLALMASGFRLQRLSTDQPTATRSQVERNGTTYHKRTSNPNLHRDPVSQQQAHR
jgi:16S rRNA (cytidine1402-2'-O)-methyltransferase